MQEEEMNNGRPLSLLSGQKISYNSKSAVCPFFAFTTRDSVGCEGINKRVHKTILYFTGTGNRDIHMKRYCENIEMYEECPVYRAIMLKYEGGKHES